MKVKVLLSAKIGQPLLIVQKYDRVQKCVVALWKVGTPVHTFFVRSIGTAVIKRKDPGLLTSAGKFVVLTKDWACYLLHRMGYVK